MRKLCITREELEECVDNGMRYDDIARKYNCSLHTVDNKFRETGARRPVRRTKNRITKEMLSKVLGTGKNRARIAEEFGCSAGTVDRLCHRYDLPLPGPYNARSRKKTFDTRFFREIDTEEKAYILGFISADGGRDRDWGIKISVHPRDVDVLSKMARAMKCDYDYRIVEHGTRACLSLYDIDMVSDLERYGIVKRKTYTLPFARNVPDCMITHYMRGMFDGDGSFSRDKGQANFVCGSKDFISGMLDWAKSRYGFDLWHKEDGGKTYVVIRKSEHAMVDDMYANASIYLDRKMKLYRKFWVKQ